MWHLKRLRLPIPIACGKTAGKDPLIVIFSMHWVFSSSMDTGSPITGRHIGGELILIDPKEEIWFQLRTWIRLSI
jgi:hypothetical protein